MNRELMEKILLQIVSSLGLYMRPEFNLKKMSDKQIEFLMQAFSGLGKRYYRKSGK